MAEERKSVSKITYELNEPILLNYSEDLLGDEDFGMSGIVLKSPFEQFKHRLDETYYYGGTIKELPEWCIIEYKVKHDTRDVLRVHTTRIEWIKKHTSFEKCGSQWVYKDSRYY